MLKSHSRLISLNLALVMTVWLMMADVVAKAQAPDTPQSNAAQAPEGAKVLAPGNFSGVVSQAYTVAQKNPAVLSKVFCYCGCDREDNHQSLLDCFTSNHGVGCATCRAEALTVGSLLDQHKSVAQIENTIDSEYARSYLAGQKTIAYRHYLETKQY